MQRPLVTEIQRYSLQDGPGIRTTIFLKGCPLRCPWCHNPETQSPQQEYYYYQSRCVACGRCAAVCPTGASVLGRDSEGRVVLNLDRDKCDRCMRCVDACLNDAREIVGRAMSYDEIMRELVADRPFFENSGGGVTISGGDPLLHPRFTLQLARGLKAEGIHVAIETSCFPKHWKVVEALLGAVDLFIVDLKSMDPEKHAATVGWPLEPIMRNLKKLLEAGAQVRIHIPVIPGFNDSDADFDAYIRYLGQFAGSLAGVDVLNYHTYGEGKYINLGRGGTYKYRGVEANPPETVIPLVKGLRDSGIRDVTVGGLLGAMRCTVGSGSR